ncbi:CatB-related O-acetyltransferase [Clostridium minihomine]|uniref:CatB-related O-acetyltransferase n=1 Tax=Clostridium minihomine TaxID=2045012 RepID=UPI000C75B58F|nr:CatB-related O-acetyltransferase [Clostridium minihomine]
MSNPIKNQIPDPNAIFANEYKTTCFLKNIVTAPNIIIGDYTYYDDDVQDPTGFEKSNILYNWPDFGDKLIIGKFCCIASGTQFVMDPANHRMSSVTTYPFNVFGGAWTENTAPHLSELPFKGDTIIGNDVWIGRECLIMPGVKIGDGAIVASRSVVVNDIPAYTIAGGNPSKIIKKRFEDEELIELLLKLKWWDFEPEQLVKALPLLCDSDLSSVKKQIKDRLQIQ